MPASNATRMLPVTASDGIHDSDVTLLSYLMPPASPDGAGADRVLPGVCGVCLTPACAHGCGLAQARVDLYGVPNSDWGARMVAGIGRRASTTPDTGTCTLARPDAGVRELL